MAFPIPGGLIALVAAVLLIPNDSAAAERSRQAQIADEAPGVTGAPLSPHVPDELLVRFKSSQGARAARIHAAQRATVLQRFTVVSDLERVRLPAGTSVEAAARAYRADPSVLYAEPNYLVEALAIPNDTRFVELWGLHNTGQESGVADADIDAPEAWNVSTGSSDVVIAVIDTGMNYTHVDLAQNMWRNEIECTPNGVDDDANGWIDDCHGIDTVFDDGDPDAGMHGSHVAGTIGARGNNGTGVVGVNWDVRILNCKFLFRNAGNVANAVRCLEYVAMMKDRGVNIVASNNSWGGTSFSQALLDAIDEQRARGIVFVASAGNTGTESAGLFPSSYYLPNMITVAATTRTDALAGFSSFGATTAHLGAPGQSIVSTTGAEQYESLNGTSMAAPHVTGTIGLLKAHDPSLDWKALRNLVLAGGDSVPALGDTTVTGRRLNAHGALTCSGNIVAARLRPVRAEVSIGIGQPLPLAALHIDCAAPAGNVSVTVEPGGATFDLFDDGSGFDQEAGDGVYSGTWSSMLAGTYSLTIAGSAVIVRVGSDSVVSPAPAQGHRFASALAAEGSRLLVGEVGNDTGARDAGAAHLIDVTTGTTLQSFYNPDPGDTEEFGTAVALSGNYVLVGTPYDDVPEGEPGAAYLFDATTGTLLHSFRAPVRFHNGHFGHAVTFVNGQPAIGSPGDDGGFLNEGAVYLFDRDSGALLHTFRNFEPAADESFGWSLTTLDSTLVVGAPQDGPASEPGAHVGILHLYDADLTSPTFGALQRTIWPVRPPGGLTLTFGLALASHADTLLVADAQAVTPPAPAAEGPTRVSGAVYVFDGPTGSHRHTLLSPTRQSQGYFGWSTAMTDAHVFVGAPLDNTFAIGGGAVYVFEASSGALLRVLSTPAPGIGNSYGFAMTPADGGIFAGAPQDDATGIRAGAAYRLAMPPTVDRARCYKAKNASGAGKLPQRSVTLTDPLASTTSVVLGPLAACHPTSQSGSPIAAPATHLTCHKLKDVGLTMAPTDIRTLGPLGIDHLTVSKPYALCAPSGYDGDSAPTDRDAYKCYRAKTTKDRPKHIKQVLALSDENGPRNATATKPLAVCAPVAIDGAPIVNADTYLTCYQTKDSKGQAPITARTVTVSSSLGAEILATSGPTMLCVPSQRLEPTAPAD